MFIDKLFLEYEMSKFKFDGAQLKSGSKVIATVRGDRICEGAGSRVVATLRGNNICEGAGSKVLANIRGDNISLGSGASKIATIKDIDKIIDGPGRNIKVALWFYFCR
jgi:hypothetical protein